MRTFLLASITMVASFAAPSEKLTRVFELQHADAARVGKLLNVFPSCGTNYDSSLRRLIICAHTKEDMAAIEEAIAQMDRAARGVNLELTIYFLTASNGPAKASSQPLLPALEPVTKQLANVLAFKTFQLTETLIARTREGQPVTASSSVGDDLPTRYYFHIDSSSVSTGDRGRSIRLDNLQVVINRPYTRIVDGKQGIQFATGGIDRTDVQGREGQSLVVGKTSINNSNEATIIVLIPRILD